MKKRIALIASCVLILALSIIPTFAVSIDPDRVIDGGQISDGINATGDSYTGTFYLYSATLQAQLGYDLTGTTLNVSYALTSSTYPRWTSSYSTNAVYRIQIKKPTSQSFEITGTDSMTTMYINPVGTGYPSDDGDDATIWSRFKAWAGVSFTPYREGWTFQTSLYYKVGSSTWKELTTTNYSDIGSFSRITSDTIFAVGYKGTGTTPDPDPDPDPDIPTNPTQPTQKYYASVHMYGNGGYYDNNQFKQAKTIKIETDYTYTYYLPNYINGQTYAPTKEGYTFAYYSTTFDGSSGMVNAGQTYQGDINLYAIYTRNVAPPQMPADGNVAEWKALVGATLSGVDAWLNVLDVEIFGLNIRNAIVSIITVVLIAIIVVILWKAVIK